jgi:uncharacterized tellurite resistance protein B-like protein
MVIHDNFQDFVLFLYIHVAVVDAALHGSEEEVILEKMGKLFPSDSNFKVRLEEAVAHYKTLSHETVGEIIRDTFLHFNQIGFDQKYKVYTDMYDVVNADGKVEAAEKAVLNSLKEIIDRYQ